MNIVLCRHNPTLGDHCYTCAAEASKPKRQIKRYNGHRSYNAWNVALWIGNDEYMYRLAQDCLRRTNRNGRGNREAANLFIANIAAEKTPDGAPWGFQNVRSALLGLVD